MYTLWGDGSQISIFWVQPVNWWQFGPTTPFFFGANFWRFRAKKWSNSTFLGPILKLLLSVISSHFWPHPGPIWMETLCFTRGLARFGSKMRQTVKFGKNAEITKNWNLKPFSSKCVPFSLDWPFFYETGQYKKKCPQKWNDFSYDKEICDDDCLIDEHKFHHQKSSLFCDLVYLIFEEKNP